MTLQKRLAKLETKGPDPQAVSDSREYFRKTGEWRGSTRVVEFARDWTLMVAAMSHNLHSGIASWSKAEVRARRRLGDGADEDEVLLWTWRFYDQHRRRLADAHRKMVGLPHEAPPRAPPRPMPAVLPFSA